MVNMVSGDQPSHASHPKRAEFQRFPIVGVLLYLCLHLLPQNDQIWHCNTYGEGRVIGGQPRHCINASRGLSAIVEFLVVRMLTQCAIRCQCDGVCNVLRCV